MINPFPNDPDRSAIWTMLVARDIDAYLARDWAMVEDDFVAEGFFGLHAQFKSRPDDWILAFPELPRYRDEWLRQANATANVAYAEPLRPALLRATDLSVIDIVGARAVARKKFNGVIARADGGSEKLDWQTLYFCSRRDDAWKITGFVGYLPRLLGGGSLWSRIIFCFESVCRLARSTSSRLRGEVEIRVSEFRVRGTHRAVGVCGRSPSPQPSPRKRGEGCTYRAAPDQPDFTIR